MNSIFDRKSIRKFKEKKVGEEEIRLLLRAMNLSIMPLLPDAAMQLQAVWPAPSKPV